MNKKGSIDSLIFWVVVLIFASGLFLVFGHAYSSVDEKLQANADLPAKSKEASSSVKNIYDNVFDEVFLFLALGMVIASFVLASLVRISPIFIPFYILSLLFIIIIAAAGSNYYQELASSPALIAQADKLIFMSTVMNYLPWIIGIMGTVLMVIMYKARVNND